MRNKKKGEDGKKENKIEEGKKKHTHAHTYTPVEEGRWGETSKARTEHGRRMTKKEQKHGRERVSGRVPAGINRIEFTGERGGKRRRKRRRRRGADHDLADFQRSCTSRGGVCAILNAAEPPPDAARPIARPSPLRELGGCER